jgi:hypothetical protein
VAGGHTLAAGIAQDGQRGARCWFCPKAAVGAMPARLLLLCLPFRSSWLTVEGGRGRRRHSAASSGRTGRRGRVGRRGWWRSRATARHSGSSSAAFWGCRTLLLGSCLKPVAGASSGPTRVLLRPPCEPRGRWQARPNSHEVAPGPGPRSRAVPKRRPRVGGFRWLRAAERGRRTTAREGPPALSVVVEVGEFERAEAG